MPGRRYIVVAFVGPGGFVKLTHDEGTKDFDTIWRDAPAESTHIVLFADYFWYVTDRFRAVLHMDASVSPGPMDEFDTREAAIMAAIMKAGHGSDRREFITRLMHAWSHHNTPRLDTMVKCILRLH